MIRIILALDENGVIGKGNKLPWKSKEELNHFYNLTVNNVLIMGNNTFKSLPKQLNNRIVIVVSNTSNTNVINNDNSVLYVNSIDNAINLAKQIANGKDIFITGGKSIYEYCLNNKLYDTIDVSIMKTIVPDSDDLVKIDIMFLLKITLLSKQEFTDFTYYKLY